MVPCFFCIYAQDCLCLIGRRKTSRVGRVFPAGKMMRNQKLTLQEKAGIDQIARKLNHMTVGVGAVGVGAYSVIDYLITPPLWLEFLWFRIFLVVFGLAIMTVNMIRKKGTQLAFYVFWIP